jgi:hypothetical protein
MADSFIKGNEDTQTQQDVLEVERDVAALKRTALRELHSTGCYSDADLGEALGTTRQAAFQMRTRDPQPRKGPSWMTG